MGLAIFSKVTTGLGKIFSARGDSDGRLEVIFGGNFVVTASVSIGTSSTDLYTCPGGKKAKVWIEFANNDAAANRDITFNIIPNGGSAGGSNQVLDSVVIPANSVGLRLGPYALAGGDIMSGIGGSADTIISFVFAEEFDV